MQSTDLPSRVDLIWASQASSTYVRTVPDTTADGNAASFALGFPPNTFVPLAAGGAAPDGRDFNGALQILSAWARWMCAGGPVYYDSGFANAVGGYPLQAVVANKTVVGGYWLSLVQSNLVDPDNANDGSWASFNVINNSVTTGDVSWRPTDERKSGWVRANFLTIGDSLSNATERANADTFNLFDWIWKQFTDTTAPIFTSAGAASARGVSSAADFALHKAISTPDMRGRWPGGTDSMGNSAAGRLSTATFVTGNATTAGSGGNFVQPGGGSSSASFQTGTWYLRL